MRPKSLLLLVVALGCGLAASVGINRYLAARQSGPAALPADTVPILVASVDISQGESIGESMVVLEPWPKERLPQSAITDPSLATGRIVKQKVYKGEPVLEVKLAAVGARGTAGSIPKGMRAFTVKVDDHAVAGFVSPGDHVDVLLTLKRRGNEGEPSSNTILENVQVWAVDQQIRKDEDDDSATPAKAVTLVVTPQQAVTLNLATDQGSLRLALRNNIDQGSIATDRVTLSQLEGAPTSSGRRDTTETPAESQPTGGGLLSYLNSRNTKPQQPETAKAEPEKPEVPMFEMEIIRGSEIEKKSFPLQ